jgi:hypothetical protein
VASEGGMWPLCVCGGGTDGGGGGMVSGNDEGMLGLELGAGPVPEGRPESSPAESVSPHPVGDSGPGDWDAAFPTRVVSLCAPLSQSLLLLPCNLPASPAAALRGVGC